MMRLSLFVLFAMASVNNGFAAIQLDSTAKAAYVTLADKMRLLTPELGEGEYEVRIWNRQSLAYGTAQTLYVLRWEEKVLTASKYAIRWKKNKFKYAAKLQPTVPVTPELWSRLVHYKLLTLPDEAAIYSQLHPRQRKDSTWTSVGADGSISVHAKKSQNSVWILDGEDYYIEVFSAGGHRGYSYSNPRGYVRHKPDIVELRNMVAILDEVAALFR